MIEITAFLGVTAVSVIGFSMYLIATHYPCRTRLDTLTFMMATTAIALSVLKIVQYASVQEVQLLRVIRRRLPPPRHPRRLYAPGDQRRVA
jgi:hypothetical protein